ARWALHALEALGPRAAENAADTLAVRATSDPGSAAALFAIDEERAHSLDVHRTSSSRLAVLELVSRQRGYCGVGQHLAPLIHDRDLDVVRFALESRESRMLSLREVAEVRPDLIPAASVRERCRSSDPTIRNAAMSLLADLHYPNDAHEMLAEIIRTLTRR